MHRILPCLILVLAFSPLQAGEGAASPWPDPAQATSSSDAEAAALVAEILAHPLTRILLDADAQCAQAIPPFEQSVNVLVRVQRQPLIHVLLTPWWQYIATRAGAPRPVMLGRGDDEAARPVFVLAALGLLPPRTPDGTAPALFFDPLHPGEEVERYLGMMRHAQQGLESLQLRHPGIRVAGDGEGPTDRLAIVRAGRLLVLEPRQARALARPVMTGLSLESPLRRVVDATMDRLPLAEAASTLAGLAGADLSRCGRSRACCRVAPG